jgi:hypothetical protein
VVTFGCQMNKYDSLLVEGRFGQRGYRLTERMEDADVVLFNTCSVGDYFPDESPYCLNLAQQGLVYHLLRAQKYEQAIEPLEELAATREFKSFGIAGLVVVYTNLNDDERALDENGLLSTEMRTALAQQSPTMAGLLSDALDELADRATY